MVFLIRSQVNESQSSSDIRVCIEEPFSRGLRSIRILTGSTTAHASPSRLYQCDQFEASALAGFRFLIVAPSGPQIATEPH